MTEWKYYRNGEIVDYSEEEFRHALDHWKWLSNDRGASLFIFQQLWAEIDRLREEVKACRSLIGSAK